MLPRYVEHVPVSLLGNWLTTPHQSYTFNDSAHGARLFGLKEFGNIYSRIMNVGDLSMLQLI